MGARVAGGGGAKCAAREVKVQEVGNVMGQVETLKHIAT